MRLQLQAAALPLQNHLRLGVKIRRNDLHWQFQIRELLGQVFRKHRFEKNDGIDNRRTDDIEERRPGSAIRQKQL